MTTVYENPLWRFALSVYPAHLDSLLAWQERHGVHINDVLWLAYAHYRGVGVDWQGWRRLKNSRARRLLGRVRRLRRQLERTDPCRRPALDWELALEAIDLRLLYACIDPDGRLTAADIDVLAGNHGVDEAVLTDRIHQLARTGKEG